jgi:hypothetical protein
MTLVTSPVFGAVASLTSDYSVVGGKKVWSFGAPDKWEMCKRIRPQAGNPAIAGPGGAWRSGSTITSRCIQRWLLIQVLVRLGGSKRLVGAT